MFFAETGKPGRYPLSRGCDGDSRQNAEQPAENQKFSVQAWNSNLYFNSSILPQEGGSHVLGFSC